MVTVGKGARFSPPFLPCFVLGAVFLTARWGTNEKLARTAKRPYAG